MKRFLLPARTGVFGLAWRIRTPKPYALGVECNVGR